MKLLASLTLATCASAAFAVNPILTLDVVGPIGAPGSDARATGDAALLATIGAALPSGGHATPTPPTVPAGWISVDPSRFAVTTNYNARVYFISESAGFQNSLGVSTSTNATNPYAINPGSYAANTSDDRVIFGAINNPTPTPNKCFVDLAISAGEYLQFFVGNPNVGSPTSGQTSNAVFWGNAAANGDSPVGLQHIYSYLIPGTTFVAFLVEDLLSPGGQPDWDYNDVMFAIDFGKQRFTDAPEPAAWLAFGGMIAMGLWFWRRQRPQMA